MQGKEKAGKESAKGVEKRGKGERRV